MTRAQALAATFGAVLGFLGALALGAYELWRSDPFEDFERLYSFRRPRR